LLINYFFYGIPLAQSIVINTFFIIGDSWPWPRVLFWKRYSPGVLNDKGRLPLGMANNGDHLWDFVCRSRQGTN
jgi:hypothetical protein